MDDTNGGRGWCLVLVVNNPLSRANLVLGVFADSKMAGRVSREYTEMMAEVGHLVTVERHWFRSLNAIMGVDGEPS